MKIHFILGSSSQWRKKILKFAIDDYPGAIIHNLNPDIDEKAIRDPNPSTICQKIAKGKADALISRITEVIPLPEDNSEEEVYLFTYDQVTAYTDPEHPEKVEIREKPVDSTECIRFLQSYQKSPAVTHSAVVITKFIISKKNGVSVAGSISGVDVAKTFFKREPMMTEEICEKIINSGDGLVMSCCGGFAIDDPIMKDFIDRIEGEEESVLGLPVKKTKELLKILKNSK